MRASIGVVRPFSIFFSALVLGLTAGPCLAQAPAATPLQELAIGRDTFFDFGPPNHYFDIFILRRDNSGTLVQKISLTPEVSKCTAPAKTEFVQKSLPESLEQLLDGKDPCQISDKALRKESKKQKKAMGYSGAVMTLQLVCAGQTRLLATGIGDKDWFSSKPDTPRNTSWTMSLLARLDKLSASDGMKAPLDRKMFEAPEPTPPALQLSDPALKQDLASGKYDSLFPGTLKASEIYKASLVRPPKPTVELVSSTPDVPLSYKLPDYPKLPWIVNVGGQVRVDLIVDAQGEVSTVVRFAGQPMLEGAVRESIKDWKFPPGRDLRDVTVFIDFKLNCDAKNVSAPAANSEDKGSVKR